MLTPIEYLSEFNQIGLFNQLSTNDYNILQERFTSLKVTDLFTTLSPNEQINLKNSIASSEANLSDILPIWVLREVKDGILYLKDWKKPIYQLDDYKAFVIKLQSISHNQFDIDSIKAEFFELDEASKAMM